ncbi:WD40 repeat-like protein [Rickenella mellea]|uniref:WD40 repeat-like protein n=1 Tax=Rickenella mellea TaxID=50990 RepID=A0A4R5XGS2_9AGAM|nr:WD40 repeat-like protein [Rickenella mellea]
MSLTLSSSFSSNKPTLSHATLPIQAYVLSLAALPSHYAASVSTPSNEIYLFDKSNFNKNVQTLPGHEIAITSLRTAKSPGGNRDALISCGKDGVVRVWDERQGTAALEMLTSRTGQALLSCDSSVDGLTVAAGTELQGEDAFIIYWDPRNPAAPLRTHSSAHSDDVTVVRFDRSPLSRNILLSASSDGLVSISDPSEDDEDESVLHVGNWGCSVSNTDWIAGDGGSPSNPRVWASSDMETFSTWSNELDLQQDLDRGRFTYPNEDLTWVTDYIIDCHSLPDNTFHVFAGSNEGDIAMLSPSLPFESTSQWSLDKLYTSAHSGVVRCTLWDDAHEILISGGEDSRINVWSCPTPGEKSGRDEMDVDVAPPRKRGHWEDRGDSATGKRSRALYD